MTAYVAQGLLASANTYFCIKPSATLSDKIIKADFWAFGACTVTVSAFTGGGTITGGSTVTPTALRAGSPTPTALSTVKNGATTISGTQGFFTNTVFGTSGGSGSFSAPVTLLLGAATTTVFAISCNAISTLNIALYFDEVRLQPSF